MNVDNFTIRPSIPVPDGFARYERLDAAKNLYFSHFRIGTGFATVALVRSVEYGFSSWAVSFCSPGDQFSRSKGRQQSREDLFLCLDRNKKWQERLDLVQKPCLVSFDEVLGTLPRHEACEAALRLELKHRRKPSFVKKNSKIEPVTRQRAKKRLGNLKEEV
jgi:hypothetical protein